LLQKLPSIEVKPAYIHWTTKKYSMFFSQASITQRYVRKICHFDFWYRITAIKNYILRHKLKFAFFLLLVIAQIVQRN